MSDTSREQGVYIPVTFQSAAVRHSFLHTAHRRRSTVRLNEMAATRPLKYRRCNWGTDFLTFF